MTTRADILAAQAIVAMLAGTGVEADTHIQRLAKLDPIDYPSK